jgi:hypothetical protein
MQFCTKSAPFIYGSEGVIYIITNPKNQAERILSLTRTRAGTVLSLLYRAPVANRCGKISTARLGFHPPTSHHRRRLPPSIPAAVSCSAAVPPRPHPPPPVPCTEFLRQQIQAAGPIHPVSPTPSSPSAAQIARTSDPLITPSTDKGPWVARFFFVSGATVPHGRLNGHRLLQLFQFSKEAKQREVSPTSGDR